MVPMVELSNGVTLGSEKERVLEIDGQSVSNSMEKDVRCTSTMGKVKKRKDIRTL